MITINITEYVSPKGIVHIEGPVIGEYLIKLDFDSTLNNFRNAFKQKHSLANIADAPDGVIYIATHYNKVIGYITFHKPDPNTRWLAHPQILELGAIEVAPEWRNCKIAKNILLAAFGNSIMEDYIVVTMEYCWHWDLDRSGLSIWNYQKMLTGLFSVVGLKKTSTNDPEILENPANVLMSRIGKNVSFKMIKFFNALRFDDDFKDPCPD